MDRLIDIHLRQVFEAERRRKEKEKKRKQSTGFVSWVRKFFLNVCDWLFKFTKRGLTVCLPIAVLGVVAYAISPGVVKKLWYSQGLNWQVPIIAFALVLAQYFPIRGLRMATVVLCLIGLVMVVIVSVGRNYNWFTEKKTETRQTVLPTKVVPEPESFVVHLPAGRWVDTGIVPTSRTIVEIEPPTASSITSGGDARFLQARTLDGKKLWLRSRLGNGKPGDNRIRISSLTDCGHPARRIRFSKGSPYGESVRLWADKTCNVVVHVYQ